jgi:CheY-like chemotaxis protein
MLGKSFVILVVDDEKEIVDSVTKMLVADNRKIFGVTSPSEAYMRTANTVYDLVITDLKMPKTDGLTLIKGIRSHKINQHAPIILMTGYPEGLKTKLAEFPDIQVLQKPFSQDALEHLVSGLLKTTASPESKIKSQIESQILNELVSAASSVLKKITGQDDFKFEQPAVLSDRSEVSLDFSMVLKVKSSPFTGNIVLSFPLLTTIKLLNKMTKADYTVIDETSLKKAESLIHQIFEAAYPNLEDFGIQIEDKKPKLIISEEQVWASLSKDPTVFMTVNSKIGDFFVLGSAA